MGSYAVVLHTNKLYSNREQYEELVKGTEPYGYVYAWENLWNWNMYVGQTIDLDEREKQHIRDHKQVIDGAIDKYGEENFDRYIIDVGYSKEELDEREKYWIAYYDTFEGSKHYNCTEGGEGVGSGENHPRYGKKHSDETKKKMSEANKGEKNPMYGKTPRDETKKKLSKANKGENNPCYGRTGKKHPMYGKVGEENPNFKGYILVTNAKTGEFVGVYIGTYEIERELKSTKGKKLYHSAISAVLNGRYTQHGGYTYKRISKEEYEALLEQQAS